MGFRRIPVLCLLLPCLLTALLWARPGAAQVTPPPYDTVMAARAAALSDPQEATRAYLQALPQEQRDRTRAYSFGVYVGEVASGLFFLFLLPAFLLLTGISARWRDLCETAVPSKFFQSFLYWIMLSLFGLVVGLPLHWAMSWWHPTRFGLLHQPIRGWFVDVLMGWGFLVVMGGLVVSVLYAAFRQAGRGWWFRGWLIFLTGMLLSQVIGPLFLATAFNKFTPIQNEALRTRILAIAHDHNIPAKNVFQVDASRRTNRISAYVTGIGGAARLVMFDNTLRRCTPDEIVFILGHEMGHYVLQHMWWGILIGAGISFFGFLFVKWIFDWLSSKWSSAEVRGPADVAGLPLLILACGIFLVLTQPLNNWISRDMEHQADNFGLAASQLPDAGATAFLKLVEYRDPDPAPWVEWWFYDHPSGRSRILNCMEWKVRHPTAHTSARK